MEEKLKRKWWLPRIPEGIAGQTKCQQPDGKIADSLSDVLISVASWEWSFQTAQLLKYRTSKALTEMSEAVVSGFPQIQPDVRVLVTVSSLFQIISIWKTF